MERLLKDAQKITGIKYNISNLSDVYDAIHVIQGELGITGTTAKEAEKTIQGSANAMRSAWQNTLTALVSGDDTLDQCIENLVDSVEVFGRNIMPAMEKALGGVGTLIERLAPIIEEKFPQLVEKLLPPLLKAATSLLKGFVKALPTILKVIAKEIPNIVKQFGQAIIDAFGAKFPSFEKFGKIIKDKAGNISQWLPKVLGLFAVLKIVKGIGSKFGALTKIFGKFGSKGTEKAGGGITGFFDKFAKMKVKTVGKAVLNIGIIVGGLLAILYIVAKVTPKIKELSDFRSMTEVIALIGILGVVGSALAWLAGKVGKTSIMTVVKGVANIAITVVAMGGLLWLASKVFADGVNFTGLFKVITLMGILGTVGTVLAGFAAIIGLVPILVVVKGIANIAIVIAAFTAIIEALGLLSEIPFFNEFLDKGGEVLTKLFGILGEAFGSLIGGFGEGISNSLPTIGENITAFANSLGDANFDKISELFNALSSINGLPNAGGFFQFFTGNPYTGLQLMVGLLPRIGIALRIFYAGLGNITDFSAISSLFNALSAIDGMPNAGGFAQFFAGDPYEGLKKLMAELPSLGAAVKLFYSELGGITDFSAISSLFNALSSIKGLPNAGGFAQFFAGDPYEGLKKLIFELQPLGTAVSKFFAALGGVTDFTAISSLFNALSSVDALPNAGGFAQFFAGDPYEGLKQLIIQLPFLAISVSKFFAALGGITDFSVISNLFNALSSVDALPNEGGFAQFFAGDPYEGLKQLIIQLPFLATSVGKFFKNLGGITDFSVISDLFNALSSIDALPNDSGFAQFFAGDAYEGIENLTEILPDFGKSVKSFYDSISGIKDFGKINELFEALGSMGDNVDSDGGFFDWVGSAIFGDEETGLQTLGEGLKTFGENTKDFFNQINKLNINKLNGLWDSLKSSKDITADVSKAVDSNISDIVDKISKLPEKMADGIKNSGQSLANSIVAIWKDAVKASVAPVNKVIEGANWILKQFGSDKRVSSWTPYAKGTDGHKGGNALVNDGNGAELVQMPNGKTYIPQGRNVLIPNAPKGMKVLPAEQTAQLMGRKSPTFNYADGTGNIDIWDYIDNAKGLVGKVTDKFVNYKGLKGFSLQMSKGMVTTITGQMTAWVEKLFDECGGLSLKDYVASKGVEQWRSTVIRALKMTGQYSAANVERTLFQMQTESGGNPRAINLWDSNARKGTPSKGLMQCIDPTFKAYAMAGYNTNIYDPLSNIIASIRYAVSRYGSLARAYQGHGYANGGIATKPSIFGENGAEMAIPLSAGKRKRAIGLWEQTGDMLGLSAYSPEKSETIYTRSSNYEENTYAPQFNLTISGTNDDRSMARKVKRWVAEAMEETFTSMANKNKTVREV